MNELNQMKMLRESIARIEEGAGKFEVGDLVSVIGTEKYNRDAAAKTRDSMGSDKYGTWYVQMNKKQPGIMTMYKISRYLVAGNENKFKVVKVEPNRIWIQFLDEWVWVSPSNLKFLEKGQQPKPKSKPKTKVKKDYNAGDEIDIDIKGFIKHLRDEEYDEDEIEYYENVCDDGEGVILDGVDEGEGMYVDVNGDEFVVPYEFLSHSGGNAFGIEYDDEGNETNADDEERSFDRSRMYR